MNQSTLKTKTTVIGVMALLVITGTFWLVRRKSLMLEDPSVISGYVALGVMILLMLFNWRKKLSMLPIISARVWLVFHVLFGLLLLGLFWLHTGSVWPTGLYEQIIVALFYLVSVSGIIGYVLSTSIPSRLRHIGNEVIYERIPTEIYNLRESVKDEISLAVKNSGNETLAREYEESLAWFFARPRFFLSHLASTGKPNAWRLRKEQSLKPFLTSDEEIHFARVIELIGYKNQIDAHYANQSLLKSWLFLHLPLAAILLLFVGWHVLLVHLYVI
jgi:hypothetical protein